MLLRGGGGAGGTLSGRRDGGFLSSPIVVARLTSPVIDHNPPLPKEIGRSIFFAAIVAVGKSLAIFIVAGKRTSFLIKSTPPTSRQTTTQPQPRDTSSGKHSENSNTGIISGETRISSKDLGRTVYCSRCRGRLLACTTVQHSTYSTVQLLVEERKKKDDKN